MKKLLLTLIGSSVLLATSAFADIKVGVFDSQLIMEKAPQITVINKKLNDEFDGRKKELIAQQKTFEADRAKLQKDGAVMKADDAKKLQQKVTDEAVSLQQKTASFQQDLVKAQNAALQGFFATVKNVVAQISTKKGLNLVLTKANVAYSDSSFDITDEVLSALKSAK